jgi:hypothetical protein
VESVRTERWWVALSLIVMLLTVVSRSLPSPGQEVPALVGNPTSTPVLEETGGKRPPPELKVCALAIGLLIGGAVGIGANPLMGAACITWGFSLALVTCA